MELGLRTTKGGEELCRQAEVVDQLQAGLRDGAGLGIERLPQPTRYPWPIVDCALRVSRKILFECLDS